MERAQGMLLGLQVGDCLGGVFEGCEPQNPEVFQSDIAPEGHITLLSICLLKSLIEGDGLNVDNLGKRFVEFFDSGPKTLGNTESTTFFSMKIGLDPRECGVMSGGNGSLLRCSPLALFYSDKALKEASYLQTSLTHSNELCKACDYLFLTALQMVFEGKNKKLIYEQVTKEAEQVHLLAFDALKKLPDLSWDKLETSCFVLDTFSSAFWALLHTENFEGALVIIASKGDDSRVCSALTGVLCGAYYGAESIPERWLNKLGQKEVVKNLLSQVKIKKP